MDDPTQGFDEKTRDEIRDLSRGAIRRHAGQDIAPGGMFPDRIRAGRDGEVLSSVKGKSVWSNPRYNYNFCRINRNGGQSIGENTFNLLGAQTIEGSNWQSGGVITIPKTGYYRIEGQIMFLSGNTLNAISSAEIRLNGSDAITAGTTYNPGGRGMLDPASLRGSTVSLPARVMHLTAGDTLGCYCLSVREGGGSGANFLVAGLGTTRATWWQVEWIGESLGTI